MSHARDIAAMMHKAPDCYLHATWRTLARHRASGSWRAYDAIRLLSNNVRDYERKTGITLCNATRRAVANSLLTAWLKRGTA